MNISWASFKSGNFLHEDVLHIWNFKAIKDEPKLHILSKTLSADEHLRASKYRFEKDRAVYITARYLLRTLISSYLEINPKEIVFDYSEYDKPTYLGNIELDFNVSHSGNRIIIGLAKQQIIGVDIEKIKNDFNPIELANNVFSNDEINALSEYNGEELYRAFYRGWTRKESFIKAVGEGLSYPLKSFSVTIDNDETASFLSINNENESNQSWHLHSFIPSEGFIAAITTKGNPKKIEFFDANNLF
ncbi:4'-phosphopantetheinyl transferase superfamily protein [Aurantibacter sp.]|uniref:4'-phosphopantetheinyl transferase family protein n=1 Tax=Aurantibacter sp. TaxID=2807103 RepID=UPI003266583A